MKAGKYNIKELFSNKNIEAVIIPEIQRDYVWGTEQVQGLLQSIFDDYSTFKKSNSQIEITVKNDASLEKTLSDYYKTIKYNTSIGFIYAYSDFEYPDKYFLIDGQQRLTTIYLLMVAIASEDESFKNQFSKLYFKNSKSFIEYRVREASLLFLNQTIKHSLDKQKTGLQEQYWYYNFYKNDKTIQSIIENLKTIKGFIANSKVAISSFKDYVLNHVQFWYFDTNISEQGEQLYIYMNARGERMQSNENLKAELISQIPSQKKKNEWGIKWEEWQNDFWLIRGKHENADNVFNEFIYCISGKENLKNNVGIFKMNPTETPSNFELLKCFKEEGLVLIEKYVHALKLLLGNEIEKFCDENNLYKKWIIKTKKEIINLLNNSKTNYFIKIDDPNRGTEQNRMVLIWSVLDLFAGVSVIDLNLIITYRIIYNRYHNYYRAVQTSLNDVNKFKNKGFESIILDNSNDEETIKYKYIISQMQSQDLNQKLSLIWKIEDHPINLNGRDVGNINSSHVVDYSKKINLSDLELIKDKFYDLFPIDEDGKVNWRNYDTFLNCLISYGECWNYKVTNGYDNLDFDNERRLVRDIDSEEHKCFNHFFRDYLKESDLEALKKKILIYQRYNKQTEDSLDVIQWYSFQLKEEMWTEGHYISTGNVNHQILDIYFPKFYRFVNTKGNFNGGHPKVLSDKIKKVKIN